MDPKVIEILIAAANLLVAILDYLSSD